MPAQLAGLILEAVFHLRMSLIISGAVGLLIFLMFPVAPPRLADMGVSDTVALYDSTYQEVAGRSRFTNEFAAMPSFHLGWNLLAGLSLASVFAAGFCVRCSSPCRF